MPPPIADATTTTTTTISNLALATKDDHHTRQTLYLQKTQKAQPLPIYMLQLLHFMICLLPTDSYVISTNISDPQILGLATLIPNPTPTDVAMDIFVQDPFPTVFIANKAKCRGVPAKKEFKPMALKIKAVASQVSEDFCIKCKIVGKPLATMPLLNPNTPPFILTECFTNKHKVTFVSKQNTSLLTSKKVQCIG
ncbi:hypothetical protein C0989_007995 [Termitomyces sp. Mn162]|nr:hypothetical protein C0989_007995 [Termitomyces sp. Mn162]